MCDAFMNTKFEKYDHHCDCPLRQSGRNHFSLSKLIQSPAKYAII